VILAMLGALGVEVFRGAFEFWGAALPRALFF
jgi:hypothetical protein